MRVIGILVVQDDSRGVGATMRVREEEDRFEDFDVLWFKVFITF